MRHSTKAFFAAVLAAMTTALAVPAMGASAAPPPSNDPQIYVDFTMVNGVIRGDIKMNNMPDISSIAFHIVLGDGLQFVECAPGRYVNNLNPNANGLKSEAIAYDLSLGFVYASAEDEDLNGTFCSFYVEPTSLSTLTNSTAQIEFRDNYGYIRNTSDYFYKPPTLTPPLENPAITESGQFMYGDVDDSEDVDGSDVTRIMSAISQNGGSIDISTFTEGTLTYLPTYKKAFAADVDKDGYITYDDSDAVLAYYAMALSGLPYTGNIGTTDIYEIY